jgi:hypothetical protein
VRFDPSRVQPGLYVVRQWRPDKLVFHYGVVDVGNLLDYPDADVTCGPLIIHQPPSGLRAEPYPLTGAWALVGRVGDETGAIVRLREATRTPEYHLLGNNCEQLVNFVAFGYRWSWQLAFGAAAAFALVAWAAPRLGRVRPV